MSERTSIPPARPRPTVLLVDDELESLTLMAEALEADGFSVAQAPNGKDAGERLRGFAYDAMIVDLRVVIEYHQTLRGVCGEREFDGVVECDRLGQQGSGRE